MFCNLVHSPYMKKECVVLWSVMSKLEIETETWFTLFAWCKAYTTCMIKTGGTYPVDEGKANSRQILHQVQENKQRLQRASAPMLTTEESQQTQLQADTASHIRKKAQAGKSISNHINKQRIQQLSLLLIDLSCIEKSFTFLSLSIQFRNMSMLLLWISD